MPKNYLEHLLFNLKTITDKNEIINFIKSNKPYNDMDNTEYLNQIINAINNYLYTYEELESKENIITFENLKEICLEVKMELKNKPKNQESKYPFLDGKGRFKVIFEGFSLSDIKVLSEKELKDLLTCIQNELGNELDVKDIKPINNINDIFGTEFVNKKIGDLSVIYYRINDYTVIVGVKNDEKTNTDYTRYNLVAKTLPNIELNLKKYAKGILAEDSNHYRTIKYLKKYLTPEIKVPEKKEEKSKEKEIIENNIPQTIDKPAHSIFKPQIISSVSEQTPKKRLQWDMISDEIKSHLKEDFIDDYTTVLNYYKKYGTINIDFTDMNATDIDFKEKQKIKDITNSWQQETFKRNASLLQVKLIDNLDFNWALPKNEPVSNQTDTSKKEHIALSPITLKTLEPETQTKNLKQNQISNDTLNILKPITVTNIAAESQASIVKHSKEPEKKYIDKVIEELVKYYEDYGDTNVMPYYKVPETGFPLGKALNEIKEEYKNNQLTTRQIKILESLNFNFNHSKEEKHDYTPDEYKNIIKRRLLIKLINELNDDNLNDAIRDIDNIVNFNKIPTNNNNTKKTL